MPNTLAYLMLLLWPVVAVVLFRRLSVERALIWTILGGYLILPPVASFNLPVVPDFDKFSIPNLSAYLICTLMLGHRVPLLPASWIGRLLLAGFVLSPFATVLTNPAPIFYGPTVLPGMRLYDSLAAVANQAIILLPWFLARRFLNTPEALRDLVVALVVAGLVYSLPMLLEVRLSPQLNVWVYGFFQHSFDQMMRLGGFRPIVFLPHGLWLAFFALMTVLAALSLARAEGAGKRPFYLAAALYLAVVLVLCKSVGPLVYALAMAPVVLFFPRRAQLALAAALGLVVVVYPLMRGAGLVPTGAILDLAQMVGPDRVGSLAFRFHNEDILLAHAMEKPLFGWGGYERNLLHDAATGRITSVADGSWIIALGMRGWLGYLAEFGLLALPLVLVWWRSGRKGVVLAAHAGAIAVILAINLVDMLPNATLIPFTWLMSGALLGYAEALAASRGQAIPAQANPKARAAARPRRTVL